jgi:hypothetical protein
MSENVLIGIGGTGAKIVESVLALCACGMGPASLQVGFIDQDEPNGNVIRSRQLLGAMADFDQHWSQGAHVLDRGKPSDGGSRFMATRVSRVAPQPHDFWCPHPGSSTLASIFQREQMEPGDRRLMDALIPEADQVLELSVGYRGRPHVGSPAVAAATLGDQNSAPPFWRAITSVVQRARGGNGSRIVLAGSVFGGTGAAGFPTVARMLQAYVSQGGATSDLRVGGALMLPYYSFPPPGQGQDSDVVKDQDLVIQSQAALKYYAKLFDEQVKLFEELYVVGWDPRYELHYHQAGGTGQASPPLPPELLAATGVLRFLSPEHQVPADAANATYVSCRTSKDALVWSDIPSVREKTPREAFLRIGQTLRFAAYWRYQLEAELKQNPKLFDPGRTRHPWFRAQGVRQVDFSDAATVASLKSLSDVNELLLAWAALMQAGAEHGRAGKFDLWDLGHLRGAYDDRAPADNSYLRPAVSEPEAVRAFETLVRPATPDPAPDQAALRSEIGQAARPGNHRGLGPLLAAAHHAARLRAVEEVES